MSIDGEKIALNSILGGLGLLGVTLVGCIGLMIKGCIDENEASNHPVSVTAKVKEKFDQTKITTDTMVMPNGNGGTTVIPTTSSTTYLYVNTDKGLFITTSVDLYSKFDVNKTYQISFYKYDGQNKLYDDKFPVEIKYNPSAKAAPRYSAPQP